MALETGFPRIGLINGHQLADLLIKHSDAIPEEFQERLGLKPRLVRLMTTLTESVVEEVRPGLIVHPINRNTFRATLAPLLDSATPVTGVSRPDVAAVPVSSTADGRNMIQDDFKRR